MPTTKHQHSEAEMLLACLRFRFDKRTTEVCLLMQTCEKAAFTPDELCAIRDNLVSAEQLTQFYEHMETGREAGIDYLRTLIPKNMPQSSVEPSGLLARLRAAF